MIEKSTDSCTLLCKNKIEEPYNDQRYNVTWETCSLRAYLNDSFYNSKFSAKEKEIIIKNEIVNKGNKKTGVDGGNNTEDYVYILSYDEARKVDSNIIDYDCPLWLRTPGERANEALCMSLWEINLDDYRKCYSQSVEDEQQVCPVITIDLSK